MQWKRRLAMEQQETVIEKTELEKAEEELTGFINEYRNILTQAGDHGYRAHCFEDEVLKERQKEKDAFEKAKEVNQKAATLQEKIKSLKA